MPLHLVTHPACREHAPPDERPIVEVPARLDAVTHALRADWAADHWHEAPRASTAHLLAVHTEAHLESVQRACKQSAWLEWDTYAIPASQEAARRAAGGALAAAELSEDGTPAMALVRPPGHHATRSRAMGFCLYNNVAVAAQALTDVGHRVAIVDPDVHHGNGTQDIFEDRDDVLFISMHQAPLYPGTGAVDEIGRGPGEGFTVNLPVPAGTGHDGWLGLFDRVVEPVVGSFEPDVLLVSAGFDAHALDPLGGLRLTAETYHTAFARLRGLAPRVVAVLEGGYDLGALADASRAAAAGLAGRPCPVDEPPGDGVDPWPDLEAAVLAAHGDRWPIG